MIEKNWIYDTIIYLYAISLLLYFSDFMNRNRKVNRTAFWLLAIVWVLQTVFFASEMAAKNYLPVLTLFETLFFYSWILVTMSLVINYFFRTDILVFFTNVVGFTVLALNFFTNSEDVSPVLAENLTSDLLFIHITMAFFSYGVFSLSAVFSLMYLLLNKMLKEKRWNPILRRLPSLDRLDLFSFRLNMVGFPLLLLAAILGAIWADATTHEPFWLDPKVSMTSIVLASYAFYLFRRVTKGWQGKRLAYWNLAAFLTVLLNYLVSGSFSYFHQWL
ncbi:cytochrome c biogenesis protein [Bacillaceae bacterium]